MNSYIERSKSVVTDYLAKANETETKIANGRKIYLPESMEQEEKRLRGELAKARKAAEDQLDSIYHEASADARSWGVLDGSKLTQDAELLKGEGVTPEQFDQLVERYKDNYTMLDTLRKYGERMNDDAGKAAVEAGDFRPFAGIKYNVQAIPGPDAKMREWDDMRRRAGHFLDIADGNGMDQFAWTMARATGDADFEAWGKDPEPTAKRDSEAIQEAFRKAWGLAQD